MVVRLYLSTQTTERKEGGKEKRKKEENKEERKQLGNERMKEG